MKKQSKSKSGFAQGRSKTRPSLSSTDKKKKRERSLEEITAKKKKVLAKVEKSKQELMSVLKDASKVKVAKMPQDDGIADEISVFEHELHSIRKLVSNEKVDYNAEAGNRLLLRAALASTIDILPQAEKAFRSTSKENAAYAYVALINLAREISTELKMSGDVENQAVFIRESILMPMYKAMAQNMLHELMMLKGNVDTEASPKVAKVIKRQIDTTLKTIGEFMTKSTDKIAADIQAYLSGDMSSVGEQQFKKKKRKSRD